MKKLFSRRTELGLIILAAIIVTIMLVALQLSQGNSIDTSVLMLIAQFLGVFIVAHFFIAFLAPQADQIMLPIAALLNGIGVVLIYRLDLANEHSLASRQVLWTLVSIAIMVITLYLLRDHKLLNRYSYILGLLGLIALALPLVWPQPANVVADARIWIYLGPFSLQPGEFAKILLLMFFAQLLTQKRALFTVAGYRFLGLTLPRLRDLAPILVVWAIALFIMAISNDFGPALLLFATVLGMMYMATGRFSWLLIGATLVAIGATAIYHISAKIQERVALSVDPLGNMDISSQPAESLFALSWGGLMGTGLGQGYPYFVPVAHSDFILSALGEELGFVGLAGVLILFAIFVTRGFRISIETKDSYGKLLASGLSLLMVIQIFVVTGGITTLLPMTGLTTPFMSAGGSSLMANYILLAIMLRISDSSRSDRS